MAHRETERQRDRETQRHRKENERVREREGGRGWECAEGLRRYAHLDAVLDDADDNIVADKRASRHQRLGLLADLGAGGDGGPVADTATARGRERAL